MQVAICCLCQNPILSIFTLKKPVFVFAAVIVVIMLIDLPLIIHKCVVGIC